MKSLAINGDDIEAWDTASEHLFSVLRLTTTGAARSVLLKFEPKTVNQETVERLGLRQKPSIRTLPASVGDTVEAIR